MRGVEHIRVSTLTDYVQGRKKRRVSKKEEKTTGHGNNTLLTYLLLPLDCMQQSCNTNSGIYLDIIVSYRVAQNSDL